MPQWSQVIIPATQGLGQQLDPMAAPAEIPLDVVNGRFDKRGRIVKRFGLREKTMVDEAGATILGVRRLWRNGAELCCATARNVYELQSETATATIWIDRGECPPFGGTTYERWRDSRSWDCCDAHVGYAGGITFTSAAMQYSSDASYDTEWRIFREVHAAVYAMDGQCLLERQLLSTGARILATSGETTVVDSDVCPHAPKAFTFKSRHAVAFLKNNKPTSGTAYNDKGLLLVWDASAADLDAGFTQKLSIADVYRDDHNQRTFDVSLLRKSCAEDASLYYLAYIPWVNQLEAGADRVVRLDLRNDAHALSYTLDIARAGYRALRVSVLADPETDPANKRVHLAVLWNNVATPTLLDLAIYQIVDTGLAFGAVSAVTSVDTGTTAQDWMDNFGWELYGLASPRFVLSYGYYDHHTAGSPQYRQLMTKVASHTGIAGGIVGPTVVAYNAAPMARPWTQVETVSTVDAQKRLFLSLASFNHDYDGRQDGHEHIFETRGIHEVVFGGGAVPSLKFCGRHSVGTDCGLQRSWTNSAANLFQGNAPWSLRQGSANSVSLPANSATTWLERFRAVYAHPVRAETIDDSVSILYKRRHRMAAAYTSLDVEAPRVECSVTRGGGIIGGAVPCWYDGATIGELGFTLPPFIFGIGVDSGGGAAAAGSYTWQAMWATSDDHGLTARGLPSYGLVSAVLLNDAAWVYTRSNPHTMRREPLPLVTVQLYRSDANGIMRRVLHPTAQIPNYQYGSLVDGALNQVAWDTFGETNGAPLYTEGAVYESVGVEGCDISAVALERAWLGGAFHRDVLYYSKRFPAASGGLLPEFHEAFTMVVPDGRPITGISSVGDKVVVLSDNAVYAAAGLGPADDGSANDFSQLVRVSHTEGCADARSVVSTDAGVFFWTGDTIALCTSGLSVEDVGQSVKDVLDAVDTVASAEWWPEESCVVFGARNYSHTTGSILTFDLRWRTWSRWTPLASDNSTIVPEAMCALGGKLYVADYYGKLHVAESGYYYDGIAGGTRRYVPLSVSSGWVQAGGLSGWQLCRAVTMLGAKAGDHTLTINCYTDFSATASSTAAYTITTGDNATTQIKPAVQKCQAIRVKVTDADVTSPLYGAGFMVSGFCFDVAPIGHSARLASGKR